MIGYDFSKGPGREGRGNAGKERRVRVALDTTCKSPWRYLPLICPVRSRAAILAACLRRIRNGNSGSILIKTR